MDVLISSGTIDGSGRISMTIVLSSGGSPRQTLTFQGVVTGAGERQLISGTYVGANPAETGTFMMTQA